MFVAKIFRGGLCCLLLLGILGGCASVREAGLPKGFTLKGETVLVTPDESSGRNTSASGPKHGENERARLDKVLGELDLTRILRGVIPLVVRGMSATKLGSHLRYRGKRGRYELRVHLETVNLVQAVVGEDWYLRVDILGLLVDHRENKTVWSYHYREVRGHQLNGRRLRKLRPEHLIAGGGRLIRLALVEHLRDVLRRKLLADLETNLDEITPRPKPKPKKK